MSNVKRIEPNVWNVEFELAELAGAKKATTHWNIIAQPGPKGDLVIDITEIK